MDVLCISHRLDLEWFCNLHLTCWYTQYKRCSYLATQDLWDDPDAMADFLKLDDNWWKEGSFGLQQQEQQQQISSRLKL